MKILLAYDGFPHSQHALEEATELASGGETKIVVFSVVPESEARASKAGGHHWIQPHAHQDVAVAHKYLRDRGVDSEMKIEHGDPAEEIRKEAAAGGYDLIVVGARGRGPVTSLILGSVSKSLVDDAPCPVLVAGKDASVRHESATAAE
jgi:nucleotide-binding universal stress UspA family protein